MSTTSACDRYEQWKKEPRPLKVFTQPQPGRHVAIELIPKCDPRVYVYIADKPKRQKRYQFSFPTYGTGNATGVATQLYICTESAGYEPSTTGLYYVKFRDIRDPEINPPWWGNTRTGVLFQWRYILSVKDDPDSWEPVGWPITKLWSEEKLMGLLGVGRGMNFTSRLWEQSVRSNPVAEQIAANGLNLTPAGVESGQVHGKHCKSCFGFLFNPTPLE